MRKFVCSTLHLPIPIKAPLLLLLVIFGSLLCSLSLVPESYFSDKNNPYNKYLVKYCWGWTLICVLPSVLFTSFLYSALKWRLVVKHFGRVAVAHVIWYTMTNFFVLLDSLVGVCSEETVMGRSDCFRRGHSWIGFDISGHVFLLTYCIYILTEECANIRLEVWQEYNVILLSEHHVVGKLTAKQKQVLPQLHQMASWLIEPLELLATAEILLWTFMVLLTSLYFHSFLEKLLGFALGYMTWYFTYRWLFGRPFMPSKPEEGLLHPMRQLKFSSHEQLNSPTSSTTTSH